jgi:hypothetical protein
MQGMKKFNMTSPFPLGDFFAADFSTSRNNNRSSFFSDRQHS